ncbi:MAG: hypothetical protein QNK37_38725 [Acidobacteriota bacterium]|nr:hypothetical protein [Acidobacteriota bacterium]
MSESGEKHAALVKRLVSLTSLLVAVLLVAFSGALYRFDARENRWDVQALTLLEKLPPTEAILQSPRLGDGVRQWLSRQHPKVEEGRTVNREALWEWISSLTVAPRGPIEGKPGSRSPGDTVYPGSIPPGDTVYPGSIPPDDTVYPGSVPPEDFPAPRSRPGNLLPDILPFSLFTLEVEGLGLKTPQVETYPIDDTVDTLIPRLVALNRPARMRIVTKVKLIPPQALPDMSGSWAPAQIKLREKSVEVKLLEQLAPMEQRLPREKTFQLEAEVETLEALSPLVYYFRNDPKKTALVAALTRDEARLENLALKYGLLPPDKAKDVAAEAMVESYKSFSILGFRVSPGRFPFLVLTLCGVVLLGILASVESARRQGLHIGEVVAESPMQLAVETTWARYLFWTLLPALSLLFAAPIVSGSRLERGLLLAGALLTVFLGLIASWRAGKVFAR